MKKFILLIFFVFTIATNIFSQTITVLDHSNSFVEIAERFQTIAKEISIEYNYFYTGMETKYFPSFDNENKEKIGKDKFVISWLGSDTLDLNFLFLNNLEAREAVVFSFHKEYIEGSSPCSLAVFSLQLVSYIAKVYFDPKWYQSAVTCFQRGSTLSNNGDYNGAITEFTEAVRLDPNYSEAFYNLGYAYFKINDMERAVKEYTEAIRLNQDYADAYYSRGSLYAQMGNFTSALSDYNNAIRLNPDDAEAYSNRGNVYYETGEFDKAISDFNNAVKINPNDYGVYLSRGNAYYEKGKFDLAILDFNSVIRLNPNYVKVYFNRGIVYYDKGDIAEAIADWETFLRSYPDHSEALNNLEIAKRRLAK